MVLRIVRILFLYLPLQFAFAHPPGLSSADISLKPDGVSAKMTFAIQDIEAFVIMDTDGDADVSDTEREAAKGAIAQYVSSELKILIDNKDTAPNQAYNVNFDKQNNTTVELHYSPAPTISFTIVSKFLSKLPSDHKQYVTILDGDHHELGKKLLTQRGNSLMINLNRNTEPVEPKRHTTSTFFDFLSLGVEHILTGYDHLLFLFSLLVVTRSFWPAIKIITFFTIAHSITLALAGLSIVEIPSPIVEPLIAASIVYVGLENIFRKDRVTTQQRCFLTFFFGLIHGFGFAGVLREMGISAMDTGILVPLFSFNLGVELGQITVAVIVLPLIWWLHRKENVSRFLVPFGSTLTCLAGFYWFLERTVLG